jgi:hypothetical protein
VILFNIKLWFVDNYFLYRCDDIQIVADDVFNLFDVDLLMWAQAKLACSENME